LTFWHEEDPRACGDCGWSAWRAKGAGLLVPAELEEVKSDPLLAALFSGLNGHYFGGALPPVPVVRGLAGEAALHDTTILAQCRTWTPAPGEPGAIINVHLSESLFGDNLRWDEISRCLLHEMAHVAVDLDEIGGRYSDPTDDHGREFANECNRIGRIVGWSDVIASGEAETEEEDAMWWPRPEEYFDNPGLPKRHAYRQIGPSVG
jgi:hypothetical protein